MHLINSKCDKSDVFYWNVPTNNKQLVFTRLTKTHDMCLLTISYFRLLMYKL